MARSAWLLPCVLLLAACGDRGQVPAERQSPGQWEHVRIEGLSAASGLTIHEDTLIAVAGGNDRDIYAIAIAELLPGGTVKARTLAVDIKPDAPLMGAEPFAVQGYTLGHLWKVTLDFQAVAAQVPNLLYVVDREHRVIFWGPMHRSVDGRLARVQLNRLTVAPGADRTGVDTGDWRDLGPGVRGVVSVPRAGRMEDLWILEGGKAGEPLQVRRIDRYGSNLGGLRARHKIQGPPDARALSWDRDRLVLQVGAGRGRLMTLEPPASGRTVSVPEIRGVPGPEVAGVDGWTGLAHGSDGAVYMVSGGTPAVLAWRRP